MKANALQETNLNWGIQNTCAVYTAVKINLSLWYSVTVMVKEIYS
jgi:hypothetical protein